jgi:hypothetical protein
VRPSPVLCTRSPTHATVLVTARHAAPATYTPRDKQTRFSNETKTKEKQNETILDSNSNLAKSMTHHNQTKELITWFLNLPIDDSIDNKSTDRRPKKPRKAQEGHLEEGKSQKPTKGTKSGKAKQNGKKELGKSQKSNKVSKSAQKLKINTPPNTLNVSSPKTEKAKKSSGSTDRRPKKPRKAQEGHLEEGKSQKPTKGTKSGKAKQNGKKELGKSQKSNKVSKSTQKLKINTPPNTLNVSSPPLIVIYHVSSLIHPVSKEFYQLCAHTLPL